MGFQQNNEGEITDINEKGKYQLVWRLSLTLTILFFIASILTFFADFYSFILYLIALLTCLFCFTYLNLKKQIRHIFWIFSTSASSVVIFSMHTLMGSLHFPDFIWSICTIVFAYIGLGKRIGLMFLFIHLISICYFFTVTLNLHLANIRPIAILQQISVLFEMLVAFFALTYLIHQYLVFQSRTERKLMEANRELEKKNYEINLLMKEIHHRIKNNLQLVISLLRMQSAEIDSIEVQVHFTEAINRILSISKIHEKLYQKENLKNFNFNEYIRELIDEIKLINETKVEIGLKIQMEEIGLKTLVPTGLLINELISNSFKHAFSNLENENRITIHIKQLSKDQIFIHYEDNGVWNSNSEHGFGLELIELLTSQMEGTHERIASKFEFRLKNLDLEEVNKPSTNI